VQACQDLGLFKKEVRGTWMPCRPDDPAAVPDLGRLVREACWDRADRRFVRGLRYLREGGL
jgi:hypothetical protein